MLALLRRPRRASQIAVPTTPGDSIFTDPIFTEHLERCVAEAASVLDEHWPDWHKRVTRPLDMDDVHDCVLGQVFDGPGYGLSNNGFANGLILLKDRGFMVPPGVFSLPEAEPYWNREIGRRKK